MNAKECTKLLIDLQKNKMPLGRMICYSKSVYLNQNPNNQIFFNANIVVPKYGKIWFGDLDISKDSEILRKIALKYKTIIYVLREMDGRFYNEKLSVKELIKRAAWSTLTPII